MAVSLPAAYIDNVEIPYTDTLVVRGNTVYDIEGSNEVVGIEVKNAANLLEKNNKAYRVRSKSSNGTCFKVENCDDSILIYNTASRSNTGFYFSGISDLDVYNLTSHNCNTHIRTQSSGVFRNVALSNYKDHITYKNSIGIVSNLGTSVNLDYMLHFNVGTLYSGETPTTGSSISEKELLYLDEQNDDLTPDYISEAVNSGTDNPLHTDSPCIGGIESAITTEETADRKYNYDLIDNSFWHIDNPKSGEMSFIKAFQSRIAANCEAADFAIERDMYIKTAESVQRYSELYPMYQRYVNQMKFKKRVMDMWFAGQNPATLMSYNNAIGGYNLFPSFFKRMEDVGGWIVDVSHVDDDNWLIGTAEQQYGILIDVLGTSTLTQGASAECYNNTQKSVSDVAPVYWNLHHEPQPPNYLLFTDLYNNFENCVLENMIYNDEFNIMVDEVQTDGKLTTPLIPTATVSTSGDVAELSVLDRVNSEIINRTVYYRQGSSSTSMGSWTEVTTPIGEQITITDQYIQFKVEVEDVLRQIDYEFIGLCLRPYTSTRDWTQPDEEDDMAFIELLPKAGTWEAPTDLEEFGGGINFPNDGNPHQGLWTKYVPEALQQSGELNMRFLFGAAVAGTGLLTIDVAAYNEDNPGTPLGSGTVSQNVVIPVPGPDGLGYTYFDIDIGQYLSDSTTYITITLTRDSSDAGDTLAANLSFFAAHTIET